MDLITGANGFIGGRLARALATGGLVPRLAGKGAALEMADLDLGNQAGLEALCKGVECVFHCAGHAHAFAARAADEAALHWRVNFEGARNMAAAAAQSGVRCFVLLSSVKAMAEPGEQCADEEFPGEPLTDYGRSKRAAERAVAEIATASGMRVVNLRLAMVYGRGGRGNLERMGRMVARGAFPPLPETGNRRSLIHVDDVVDAMRHVARDMRANGRTYILASPEAPSGRELYDALRVALGLQLVRSAVPAVVLRGAARAGDALASLTGRRVPLDSEMLDRLLGSAHYSPERISRELGWRARVSLAAGLAEMFGDETPF